MAAHWLTLLAAVAATPGEDVAALEKLNAAWLTAYRTHDVAAIERILADDFEALYPGDRVLRKADVIRTAAGTTRDVKTIAWERLRVKVFGDTAVVFGRMRLSGIEAGAPFSAQNDYADVYVRRAGTWRAISAHVVPARD